LVRKLGIGATGRLAEGPTAQQIMEEAGQLRADLIVLSSIGRSGSDAWPLGATAQKILALSTGAILIVPTSAHETAFQVPPRRISVRLAGSLRSETVLPTAPPLAAAFGADVVLTHVVSEPVRSEVLAAAQDLGLAHQLSDRLMLGAQEYLERVQA